MINKTKYSVLFFIACFDLNFSGFAQNDPYRGGSGRGDLSKGSNVIYFNGDGINNLYRGGNGRGDLSFTSQQGYFNNQSINILYAGGIGRGDNISRSNSSYFNGESPNILYAGGIGKGDNKSNSFSIYMNNESVNVLYSGGQGRGDFMASNSNGYFNGESANLIYRGGIGRGDHASIRGLDYFNVGPVTLSLRLFIEGFYTGGGLMQPVIDPINSPGICDAVTLELHEAIAPFNLVFNLMQLINTNGNGTYVLPPGIRDHSFYIVVKHRNSIETWSTSPVLFNSTGISYTFTDLITRAFGNNMRNLGGGDFAIWSGDINQDGTIDAIDFLELDPAIQNGNGGYDIGDINGDGAVDAIDFLHLDPNIQGGIGSVTP